MSPYSDDITVINAYQFGDVSELRTAACECSQPALLLVFPKQVAEVSKWLTSKDDVCLIDSPPELIELRARQLANRVSSTSLVD